MRFVNLPSELQKILKNLLRTDVASPRFVFSGKLLEKNYLFFKEKLNLSDNSVFFSVKTNNHPKVLQTLKNRGAGFEIASFGELQLIENLKVSPQKIIYSNPVKMPSHLEAAHRYGIKTFAFDTRQELLKIARYAPASDVFLRLRVVNQGADWQLVGKFGADKNDALDLLKQATRYGLNPVGIAFHQGWNNARLKSWEATMKMLLRLLEKIRDTGIQLKFINLGGGFPAHQVNQYQILSDISQTIMPYLRLFRQKFGLEIIAEPGSFLVANTTVLLLKVFAVVEREQAAWAFVDSGITQGFYWIFDGLKYDVFPIQDTDNKEVRIYNVTGPSLDSHDLFGQFELPSNLSENDYLAVFPAGAYTNSAQNYNGFPYPELHEYE